MRIEILLILMVALLAGCIPDKSSVSVNFTKIKNAAQTSTIPSATVSSIQIINNQLVITGNGFSGVTNVKVGGAAFDESFTIESKTATKIIANSVRAFSFDVSKLFNLIISDASASATFPIDFSLCNSTLNGKGFNCAAPVADKDVLAYDAVSGTWKPRPASGLNYLGTFDASSNPGAGPAIQPAGAYYVISDDGTIAAVNFAVGDWLVSNGMSWQKIDNSSAVLSVFGRFGAVTAQHGDYTLGLLGDVSFPVAPVAGKVLKFDGTNWVAGDDLSGGGAGSVTTTAIADGAVTDAKIDTVSASKITGTITSAQILDGAIVNADINAAAAIDYSKLNVPNSAIPYAKLNIADGAIPAAKITGLPVLSSILAATITDGDTTHAPTGEAVYEALQTKIGTSGGTLSVGTISGVPAPVNPSDIVNKSYVDSSIAGVNGFTEAAVLGTDLAGLNTGVNGPITAADTVLGAFGKMQYQVTDLKAKGQWDKTGNDISYSAGNVSVDKKLRLKSDNANYVEILSPNALASTYVLTLPGNDGNANQVLKTDGAGVLAWVDVADSTVQAFAKSALPTCNAGEVLKSNGTTFSCVTDNTGAGAFSGTANSAVITTAGGALGVSATTSTELGYVSGVTSSIQTQLDAKQAALGFTPVNKAGDSISSGTFTFSGTAALRAADPVAATDVVNKQYFESYGLWSKNGSDIYRSSNVGIGISNPTYKLQVQDGRIYTTGAAAYYQVGLDTSDNNLGKISFHSTSQNTSGRYWTGLAYSNGSGSLSIGGGDSLNLHLDSGSSVSYGNHVFRKVGWDGTNRTFTESMRLDKDGNLGIGTAAPKSKLDVNGAIRVGVDATACSATIAGAMRFNTPNVEFCNGTSWTVFAASGAAVASSQITDGTIVDADVNASANIAATKLGTGVVDNTEFNYLNGVTSSIQTQLSGKQATDATLTALAAYNTNGILVQTAADTFVGRSIAGTANRLTVTNGDGISGNPTINIPTALLPSPVVGDVGKFLKATAADTSVWTALGSSDVTTALGFTPINKAGDSITTGTITLSGAALLRVPDPIALTDVANKQYVDSYGQWTKSGGDIYRPTGNVGIGATPTNLLTVSDGGTGAPYVSADKLAVVGSSNTVLQVTAPNTAASALYFSDPDSRDPGGISYSHTNDQMSFRTANAFRMFIGNTGNVGIGTSSPVDKLSILDAAHGKVRISGDGDGDQASLYLYELPTAGVESGFQLSFDGTNGASGNAFKVNSVTSGIETNRMAILRDSGNMGVGVAVPQKNLHVKSGIASGELTGFPASYADVYNEFFTGSLLRNTAVSSSAGVPYVGSGSYYMHAPSANGNARGFASVSIAFSDILSGIVNTGEVTGSYVMSMRNHYSGNTDAGTLSTLIGQRVLFGNNSGVPGNAPVTDSVYGIHLSPNASTGTITNLYSIYIAPTITGGTLTNSWGMYQADPNTKNYFAGKVGIGTTTPGGHLDVTANVATGYTTLGLENTAAGGNRWRFLASSTGAPLGANKMCIETGGPCRFIFDNVGNMQVTGTLTQSSDVRLKKDFTLLTHSLDSLSTLKGYTYYWKDSERSEDRQIGLLAQDVEKVFPEVVKTDEKGFKSVAYQNLVAPIIEALKEIRNWMFGVDKKLLHQERAIASLKQNSLSQIEEMKKLREEVRKSHQENEQLKKDIAEIKKALNKK